MCSKFQNDAVMNTNVEQILENDNITTKYNKSEKDETFQNMFVVSRPRPGLALPLFIPILRHAHQSGHLIRKVPRMI